MFLSRKLGKTEIFEQQNDENWLKRMLWTIKYQKLVKTHVFEEKIIDNWYKYVSQNRWVKHWLKHVF